MRSPPYHLRYKLVSSALQLLFQLDVVLDNSIVDDYNRLFGVQMRMGVRIRWGTMCRPPGMPDSAYPATGCHRV